MRIPYTAPRKVPGSINTRTSLPDTSPHGRSVPTFNPSAYINQAADAMRSRADELRQSAACLTAIRGVREKVQARDDADAALRGEKRVVRERVDEFRERHPRPDLAAERELQADKLAGEADAIEQGFADRDDGTFDTATAGEMQTFIDAVVYGERPELFAAVSAPSESDDAPASDDQ